MNRLDQALKLAREGFWIFPLSPRSKVPGKGMRFKEFATRDPSEICRHFSDNENNIGIYTGRFNEDEALVVVDVDVKKADGFAGLLALELEGCALPDTLQQRTPGGGVHLIYRAASAARQGVNVLKPGLDIRSRGGYVVGAGSVVPAGTYTRDDVSVAQAPAWLVERLSVAVRHTPYVAPGNADPVLSPNAIARATRQATRYLQEEAPLSIEGEGGDETAYKVAARVKDLGVEASAVLELMLDHWNPRCQPPWADEELDKKVRNAFAYGLEIPGIVNPQLTFEPVPKPDAVLKPIISALSAEVTTQQSPHEALNAEYAYVLAGGGDHVIWETTDYKGNYRLEHLNINTFHRKHAAEKIEYGAKRVPLTEDWMEWKGRRSYDGLVFMPEQPAPLRFYNLWRGFAVKPLPDGETPSAEAVAALDAFLEHALINVCGGNRDLFDWLIGYFAHLVQRPWEKPLVALVFVGEKGVGKNSLVETVGDLLGNHFMVVDDDRYLLSHFNGHLENMLFVVLDEASWAGDKKAEGRLKGLITGTNHVIEHKGEKPYTVDNKTRVAIIGQDEWVVPASHDERRFAVFHVGEGRKQDRAFFQAMRERMALGGNRLLLRYLLGLRLGSIDVNAAPATGALLTQKQASLDLVHQWWFASLSEGKIAGGDFEGWPTEANCERLRGAFRRYSRERNAKSRLVDDNHFGRQIQKACKTLGHKRKAGGYVYLVPSLGDARALWDKFMGSTMEWSE